MRSKIKAQLTWLIVGFLIGVGCTIGYSSLQIWPFEDNAPLKWIRWAGKSTIKWGFVAIVFSFVLFMVVQLLNYAWAEKTPPDEKRKV